MKAIVQEGYGAPERVLKLEEIDRPSVGDGDVLIRVRATSVNTPDWITVTGVPYLLRLKSGLRRPSTPVRGTDVAGVVEAVGKNVADLEPGDEVFGSSWADTLATPGTFAELAVVPVSKLIKKPIGLAFEEAAGIRHVGPDRADRHPRPGQGRRGNPGPDQRGLGRRRDVCGPDRKGARCGSHRVCAAPATASWSGRSARITSLTTRRRTSPAASGATTSSSTTS
jgi:Alcohol dehydrogenase GroES-like domain